MSGNVRGTLRPQLLTVWTQQFRPDGHSESARLLASIAKASWALNQEYFGPPAQGRDLLPGERAYSHAIALSSAAKAYEVLGDEKYLRDSQRLGHEETQQLASGGWGPKEAFVAPQVRRPIASTLKLPAAAVRT
jgi:hypothetical protein